MRGLKAKNYINDRMFVESYTRSEIISKGKPVIRVLQKLREK
jgi:SOS response regulatory protein OraA/RecX